jgi:transcriptional regulator with XRE-family HTH domain
VTFKALPGSPRRTLARRFGRRLRRAIEEAGVSVRGTALQTGLGRTQLHNYLSGESTPRLETAVLLARALNCQDLHDIIKRERVQNCARPTCTNIFVNEGTRKYYCSTRCRTLAEKSRDRSRYNVANVATEFERYRSAVHGMCFNCEPEGVCFTANCPLRDVSPLPLVSDSVQLVEVVPMPGPYGTAENRASMAAARRRSQAKRWAKPGEREAQSARARRFWDELSPEERDGMSAKISAAKRRAAAGRAQ